LDLICRKVSSISGDVRRVLQICSQTLDMAQLDKSSNKVTLEHVQKTFERLYTSTRTIFIRYILGKHYFIQHKFFYFNRNLIPIQRKVLEAIQEELSCGKGREITTINAIYDRLGMSNWILPHSILIVLFR
jgi:Cdc6-like AAA superfamily ATPase